jgi:putative membrane protein
MVSTRLSQSDLDRIEQAVKKAEASTRGEIVAVILPRSQGYRWVPFFLSGFTAVVATAAVMLPLEWSRSSWGPSLEALVMIQLTGALLGAVLSQIPAVRRFVIPRLQLDAAVEKQAQAEFVRQGVMNTNDRCGVLLLISLFEHRVHLVADQGIHSVVQDGHWAAETARLASEIRDTRDLGAAVAKSVERLGALLAEKFPRTAETVNELADRPRLS